MITRQQLLELTPDRYLAGGYRDGAGLPRSELTSVWAIAAAEQLRAKGVTAAAFDPIVAGVAKTGTVPGAGPGADLVRSCVAEVKSDADRAPFVQHLAAVLRLLAIAEGTVELNRQPVPRHDAPR